MPAQIIPLIDADRQSLVVRLDNQDCRISVWWHPSDQSWWGSVEVPVNTPIVQSRRLGTGIGLLDRLEGKVSGNIVCRSSVAIKDEPRRDAWGTKTHLLYWET